MRERQHLSAELSPLERRILAELEVGRMSAREIAAFVGVSHVTATVAIGSLFARGLVRVVGDGAVPTAVLWALMPRVIDGGRSSQRAPEDVAEQFGAPGIADLGGRYPLAGRPADSIRWEGR